MKVRSSVAVVVVGALSLVACGGGIVDPAVPSDLSTPVATATPLITAAATTVVTEPTTVASTIASTTASTTNEASTAVATEPPTVTVADGSPMLSPDGPWTLVASAPGINSVGLIYELMPKLWVFLPTQEDRLNGYYWTFNEMDRPAIEGYIKALLTRYRSTDSVPATLDDEGWDLYYTPTNAAIIKPKYQAKSDRGEYTDLDLGVVLRPTVIEDERTEDYTIVLDCEIDGAVLRNEDGSYAASATPGIGEMGYAAGMLRVDGAWKLAQFSSTEIACS